MSEEFQLTRFQKIQLLVSIFIYVVLLFFLMAQTDGTIFAYLSGFNEMSELSFFFASLGSYLAITSILFYISISKMVNKKFLGDSNFTYVISYFIFLVPGVPAVSLITFILTSNRKRINQFIVFLVVSFGMFLTFTLCLPYYKKYYIESFVQKDPNISISKTSSEFVEKIVPYNSSYIGKKFILNNPKVIINNVSKEYSQTAVTAHVINSILEDVHPSCLNCDVKQELEKPLSRIYLPSKSKIKIISSFAVKSIGLFDVDTYKYLIIEDANHNKAEFNEFSFKSEIIEGNFSLLDLNIVALLDGVSNGLKNHIICKKNESIDRNEPSLESRFKDLLKVHSFEKNEIEITKVMSHNCIEVTFYSIESALLFVEMGAFDTLYASVKLEN